MYRCDETLELMSARLDGILTPEEDAQLTAHLAVCDACRDLALELEAIHAAMSHLPEEVPAGFSDDVMAKIRLERISKPATLPTKRNWAKNWHVWGGLAAALALVALGAIHSPLLGVDSSTGGGMTAACAPSSESADATTEHELQDHTDDGVRSGGEMGLVATARESDVGIDSVPKNAPSEENTNSAPLIMEIAPSADDDALTVEKAGYKLLETLYPEAIILESGDDILITITTDEMRYTLEFDGLSEDGSQYEFTLHDEAGLTQLWAVTVDSGAVIEK